jgi:Mn-dependent DtxR family transcriptional regulator
MKKAKKLTPQHELTKQERECFELLKEMTRKRGKRPTNNEIAEQMGVNASRMSNLLSKLELKGYFKEKLEFA